MKRDNPKLCLHEVVVGAALNWLNREISLYPGLLESLERLGYHSRQRVLTIAQLRTIVECIGVP